ncbi:MAG TPA: hypothetical protein VL283_00695 [Candidatus Baltobacteraceae bacterium]|nr:hypothetical protein [Candidatus Baltobacteraceae bacterium]
MSSFEPIDLSEFGRRTGLDMRELAHMSRADRIVSPRQIVIARWMLSMRLDYLEGLISSVPLLGDPERKPYAGCRIDRYRMDPRMSKVGQTFIERGKIRALHELFSGLFDEHDVPYGISKKGAWWIFGDTAEGDRAIAQYLPPIVEQIENRHAILDGIHRFSYIRGAGTTLEIIKISDPKAPFPADLQKWDSIKAVDEKPPKDQRFFNLKPELFRDLKYVGIDG